MRWFHAARARIHLILARGAAEARIDEEVRFHVEMETERLVRDEGLTPEDARRRALVAFGGVTQHTETLRDGRGLAWLDGLSLDLKLATRMLAKYPGLTFVAVIGLAVGVAFGAIAFSAANAVTGATLPISEGNRVIGIRNDDVRDFGNGRRSQLHDLPVWREGLTTVEELGAYRTIDRNLITADGQTEPLRIAEMSAAGFRIARTAPMLGRYFHSDDELPGAPPVVVIGADLWERRFGSRPDVIGQTIQLGDARYVVVGVMPKGFAFPVNNRVWTPLRLRPADYERGQAPGIDVFGRLAPGASFADVNRQLTTIAHRLAVEFPETHAHISARAFAYANIFAAGGEADWALYLAQLLVIMLLLVIGTNVAILVYARTASRMGEIAIRSALGASRGRVIAQFFAEALALSAIAAVVGLVIAHFALANIEAVLARMGGEQMPFWMHFTVSPSVAVYSAALAVFCAVIVGVAPALKATSERVRTGLQQLSAGGSGIHLGKTWTLMIVGQVAISVALLPVAIAGIRAWRRVDDVIAKPAMQRIVTATLFFDHGDLAQPRPVANDREVTARYLNLRRAFIERVEGEPAVRDIALSSSAPGAEPTTRVETDARTTTGTNDAVINSVEIDQGFLSLFEIPVLSGRALDPADFTESARTVLINRSLARKLFGSVNPLGRHIRETSLNEQRASTEEATKPWEQIVGVIADFPIDSMTAPRMYRPLLATTADPVTIAVRTRGTPATELGAKLQQLTVATSPMLRLAALKPLEQSVYETSAGTRLVILVLELITGSTVLLSAAGIYALMAFTIARRRREIGIRTALGAGASRMLMSVLARAGRQIGAGIVIGIGVAALIDHLLDGGWTGRSPVLVLGGVVALMSVIGLLAALRPAREALRIQPTEALRSD